MHLIGAPKLILKLKILLQLFTIDRAKKLDRPRVKHGGDKCGLEGGALLPDGHRVGGIVIPPYGVGGFKGVLLVG